MNDIKVGEYVRLARNQGINRVEEVEDDYYVLEDYYICRKCGLYKYEFEYGVEGQVIGNKRFSDNKKHTFYILWTRLLYNLRKLGD